MIGLTSLCPFSKMKHLEYYIKLISYTTGSYTAGTVRSASSVFTYTWMCVHTSVVSIT